MFVTTSLLLTLNDGGSRKRCDPDKTFQKDHLRPRTHQLRPTLVGGFIVKDRIGRLASCCGQHDSVRWLRWGEWESRRRECVRWRRRGREDSSECAHRQRQTGASATQHLHHTDPHLLSRQTSPRSPPQPAEVSGSLRRASPPTTHFSSGARLFLARLREKLSFRSFSYLPQFLEYLMENGDLRAAVWACLPPRNPNCTSHMRLFADGRDPPLPTALHVSTGRCRGINRVRLRGSGTGGPSGKRCVFNDPFNAPVDVSVVVVFSPHDISECVTLGGRIPGARGAAAY